jgi:hypothetical protein
VLSIKIGIAVLYLYLDRLAQYSHLTWRVNKYSNEPLGAIHCPCRRNHVADYWGRAGRPPRRVQAAGLGAAPRSTSPPFRSRRSCPAASPETVATSVASPLERYLRKIANVTEMTSQGGVGQTRIVLQFGLDRDFNGAARDVQAAINAARADLPTSLKTNPSYWESESRRRSNPDPGADVPNPDPPPALRCGKQRHPAAPLADGWGW